MYKVYEIKQRMFESNEKLADALRADLKREKTFLLNLMSSPGRRQDNDPQAHD